MAEARHAAAVALWICWHEKGDGAAAYLRLAGARALAERTCVYRLLEGDTREARCEAAASRLLAERQARLVSSWSVTR